MLSVKINQFSYLDKNILQNISFTLEKGRSLALIGESGCGKSTILKIIYGLYDNDFGEIYWGKEQVLGPKHHLIPGMSYMKYLAQDFDLMPFVTVGENVGKFLSNFFPEQKQKRIDELLELVEMSSYKNTKAKFLSGGQMQRVALARVLAQEPEILLLDEPFSHIDNFRKNNLRRKLFRYLKDKGITVLVASHDINDVLSFSEELVVLKSGAIVEKGEVKEIYNTPSNYYTASLFGEVNEIHSKFINIKGNDFHLIYPHQLKIAEHSKLKVIVKHAYFKGVYYLCEGHYEDGVVFFYSEYNIENKLVNLKLKES